MSTYWLILWGGSGSSFEVKITPESPASSRTPALICSETGPSSEEGDNPGLLLDAAPEEMVSKARIITETIIRKFSFFCLLCELINFCTRIAPLSNWGGSRSICVSLIKVFLLGFYYNISGIPCSFHIIQAFITNAI